MGQVLHRGATTTESVRRAIQHSLVRVPEIDRLKVPAFNLFPLCMMHL